jgi:hypothetical protein
VEGLEVNDKEPAGETSIFVYLLYVLRHDAAEVVID